ncbi:MAG: hypothetical protein ACTSSP_08350 [Candidatus Asgardarchaeia archaeon]|nr:hypothetical protein [Candidatus Odinarchaeota archaeon]
MENAEYEVELYELDNIPGVLLGRIVIDSKARMVGIVRNIRITIPTFKVELVIKGIDVEIPVDVQNIDAVGNVVRLKVPMESIDTVEIEDIIKLQKELNEEIKDRTIRFK